MNWYLTVIKNYVNFGGRARRKEYWMFLLFNLIIVTVLGIVENVTGLRFAIGGRAAIGILTSLYNLFIFLPTMALSFRRLHDVNKSALWLLIFFVPVVGWCVLLVFSATEGIRGQNRFGLDPKQV